MAEASAAQVSGRQDWWQAREAAVLALGVSAEHLVALGRASSPKASAAATGLLPRVQTLITNILQQDVQVGDQIMKQHLASWTYTGPSSCRLLCACTLHASIQLGKQRYELWSSGCCVQGNASNPFLAGRALWAASKLSAMMTSDQINIFLQAAIAGAVTCNPQSSVPVYPWCLLHVLGQS